MMETAHLVDDRGPRSPGSVPAQRKLRLGIDLDGVTYEFWAAFRAWVAFRLNRALVDLPRALRWNFYADWGISDAQFEDLLAEGIAHGRLFAVGDPVEGAVEGLQALAADHEIVVITHRNRFGLSDIAHRATRHWLTAHDIPYAELHLCGTKTGFGVDLHLDDSPEVLTRLHNEGVRAVAFDQPWNSHVTDVERVHGWSEFVALVNRVASENAGVAA